MVLTGWTWTGNTLPLEGYPGHKYDAADKNNFTELIKALGTKWEINSC